MTERSPHSPWTVTTRITCVAIALISSCAISGAAGGDEIIEAARARNGFARWKDRKSEVTLESFDGDSGRTTEATVSERTDPRGEHRTLIEFTAPSSVKGTRMLHVAPRGTPDEYWIWTPASRRARRVAGNAAGSRHRDEIFSGSDMNYRDLELIVRILQWDAAARDATSEDAPCAPESCHRVTLVPKGRNEFPFSRYVLWFTTDDLLLVRVELHDRGGELAETIACDQYVRHGAFQTSGRCEITQAKAKTRAVITTRAASYDSGLGDDLFALSSLSR